MYTPFGVSSSHYRHTTASYFSFVRAFLIVLMFIFFEIYMAIEGSAPDMETSSIKEKTPRLTDSDTVKNNVKGGMLIFAN